MVLGIRFVIALGRLFRTTAFKLALVFLAIFTIFAGLILGYVSFNAMRLLDEQVSVTVSEEIDGLVTHFNSGGVLRLVRQIERRSHQPGSSLFLVTTAAGETLAGNISSIDSEGLLEAGTYELYYRVVEDSDKLVAYIDPLSGQRVIERKTKLGKELFKLVSEDPQTKLRDIVDRKVEWFLIVGNEIAERNVWPGKYIPLVRIIGEV